MPAYYDFNSSGAFMARYDLKPYRSGTLDGLSFAVKDLIDIAETVTGCGNPSWAKTHVRAAAHAVCVEQLLSQGASCLGKTKTDELAYSLMGENHFYGTPINPAAPDHVPGGSSSGSASAVACMLVDFALGTDTGGSVRVPASNCGIWGYRPSHGHISMAGVNPFAPSFDTVGVMARDGQTLTKVASILLGSAVTRSYPPPQIVILNDIVQLCNDEIQQVMLPTFDFLNKNFSTQSLTLSEIIRPDIDYRWLFNTYAALQSCEIWSSLGGWIEATQPEFGPLTQFNFYNLAKMVDRTQVQQYIVNREYFAKQLNYFLQNNKIICFPTTPLLAPALGTVGKVLEPRAASSYYPRVLGVNAISGLSRAPQITIPITTVKQVPIGMSCIAAYGNDDFLISIGNQIFDSILAK